MTAALALTGERTLPGIAAENYWFRRHQAAYEFLAGLVEAGTIGRGRLLEVGAGEGYGAALLADRAGPVCALDYDPAAVAHLAAAYPRAAGRPGQPGGAAGGRRGAGHGGLAAGDRARLGPPAVPGRVRPGAAARRLAGAVHPEPADLLPGAGPTDRPTNPFHTHEFTAAELAGLVRSAGFVQPLLYGLAAGPRLRELDRRIGGLVAAQLAVPADGLDRAAAGRCRLGQHRRLRADGPTAAERLDDCLDLILLARSA